MKIHTLFLDRKTQNYKHVYYVINLILGTFYRKYL